MGPHSTNDDGSELESARMIAGDRRGAKALVLRDGRVLLIRERRPDGSTFWTLPGGGIAPAESHRAGLERELREELDCEAVIGAPVARCRYSHSTLSGVETVYLVFRTRLTTRPAPNSAEGVEAVRWTEPTSPPTGLLEPFRHVLTDKCPWPESEAAWIGD